jgi:hypothetical protein
MSILQGSYPVTGTNINRPSLHVLAQKNKFNHAALFCSKHLFSSTNICETIEVYLIAYKYGEISNPSLINTIGHFFHQIFLFWKKS